MVLLTQGQGSFYPTVVPSFTSALPESSQRSVCFYVFPSKEWAERQLFAMHTIGRLNKPCLKNVLELRCPTQCSMMMDVFSICAA